MEHVALDVPVQDDPARALGEGAGREVVAQPLLPDLDGHVAFAGCAPDRRDLAIVQAAQVQGRQARVERDDSGLRQHEAVSRPRVLAQVLAHLLVALQPGVAKVGLREVGRPRTLVQQPVARGVAA